MIKIISHTKSLLEGCLASVRECLKSQKRSLTCHCERFSAKQSPARSTKPSREIEQEIASLRSARNDGKGVLGNSLKASSIATTLLLTTTLLTGCFQGRPSESPPIHINPNMDKQERYRPQGASAFFADGSAMRMPVAGTVARGELYEDDILYRGIDANGDTVRTLPMPVTMQLLDRGQERYTIYCTPCHGAIGDGKSIVVSRGLLPPPTFHSDLIRNYPDGHLFNVISHGIRNMPAYKHQIPVEDRWAIIAYVRALQRSQNATIDDVPLEERE